MKIVKFSSLPVGASFSIKDRVYVKLPDFNGAGRALLNGTVVCITQTRNVQV